MRNPALRILTLAFLVCWLVLPLLPLAVWSFAHGWTYPDLLPRQWSFAAWVAAFSDASNLLPALVTSATVAVAVTVFSLLLGIPAGRALGMYDFPGKSAVELFLLSPLMVPAIAPVLGMHAVFLKLGLVATPAGVVLAHMVPCLPYMILLMSGVFASLDPRLEWQARSLGASRARTFAHVTLPAIMPGILVGALFTFLVSWSQYILTLVIGSGRVQTVPLLLYSFVSAGRHDLTGAISLVYIAPALIVLAATARYVTGYNPALTRLRAV